MEGMTKAAPARRRDKLRTLGVDWTARLFEAMAAEPPFSHLPALAVMMATGCRPGELEQGVQVCAIVHMTTGRGMGGLTKALAFKIRGMTREGQGQPWRSLKVKVDHPATRYLDDLCQASASTGDGRELMVRIADAHAFAQSMGAMSMRRFGVRISAMDLRAQFASDLRLAHRFQGLE